MEYNLQRFIKAQDDYGTYDRALSEVEFGRKTSHWIWYIFPQIKGLGHSLNSNYYALQSLLEAVRYLDDPVLGSRLREITVAVLEHRDKDIEDIMGSRLDAVKFRSSMTLFDLVSPDDIFAEAIDTFFSGKRDSRTIAAIQLCS